MIRKLSFAILLSCTLSPGQSPLTTQGSSMPPPSGNGSAGSMQVPFGFSTESSSSQLSQAAPVATTAQGGAKSKARDTVKDTADEDAHVANPKPTRTVNPITARSDFERFAEDAVGRPLSVYGRQLFDEVPSTFAPMDNVPVPADYAIGPGDELLIRVWGKVDLEADVTVDRNGQISIPKVGILNVVGLRYEQLNGFLRAAVGTIYKGFELNVTMGHLRSMQIFVLGSTRQPGAYTVSSLSTLVDALLASGGPSATGTMRHIQLRRGGLLLSEFDVYDLLRKGDKSHDVQLIPGDVIYIPVIGPQIAIAGSVNEPGIFELKGETNISSVLAEAGGLTVLATTERALLERIVDRQRRRVDEFPLDASGLQRILEDGDLLKISPISSKFENAVMIRGNVVSPGRFPWHEGMHVSDLIPSRAALVTNEHWNQQNHLADERHTNMMTDIALTNAEINWDYAAIERLDEHDLSTRLITFNLGNAIDNQTSSDDQVLKIGDIITVFSRKDLPLPMEKHQSIVQIGGEVNAPGIYRIDPGETLRQLVQRAGGLTPHSYLFAAQLTRVSAREIQKAQLEIEVNRLQRELTAHYAAKSSAPMNGSTTGGVAGSVTEDQAKLGTEQALISNLANVHPTGRVVLGIRPAAQSLEEIPDFPLEDGDTFNIPQKLATVHVLGEVYNEATLRYNAGKRLSAYLNDTGGATRMADIKRTFLIRADGTVVSRQTHFSYFSVRFENIALMPGDAIIVPPKLKAPGGFMENLPAITQILSQTAMTGAMISLVM